MHPMVECVTYDNAGGDYLWEEGIPAFYVANDY